MSRPELPASPLADDGGPAFATPWAARAFALTVHLAERGAFAWADWTAALAAELAAEPDPEDTGAYDRAWLRALERLLTRDAFADPAGIDAVAARWLRAAEATPHGTPLRLENAPAG